MKTALAGLTLLLVIGATAESPAVGISIDAGLTPPEGRWILRTQVRTMSRTAPDGSARPKMDRLMIPLVVVHGLKPQLTLGLRQVLDSRTMTMTDRENEASGFGDLYVFAKYKVLRINTRDYTLGIAPVLGVEAPTGNSEVSSEYWSLNAGLYLSGRAGRWGADLDMSYGFRGVTGVDDGSTEPGDQWGVELAFARQIPLGGSGQVSLAPVLEIGWREESSSSLGGNDLENTGENVLAIAPGLKYTRGDIIVEGLVRFPVAQGQNGMQLEFGNMYLLGVRYMF